MSIQIEELRPAHVPAVVAFNQRIEPARTTAPFPVEPLHEWLPKLPGRPLFREYYVAVDDKGAVRGAYILKLQPFHVNGEVAVIGNLQLPISEGIVDKTYSHVAAQLLRDALRRQPLLFSLGMGGCDEPVARLLIAAGWSTFSVPFYFRVVHTSAFLKNIAYLRRWAALRWALDALAPTGLGWLATHGSQALLRRADRRVCDLTVESVDDFSTWADDLWRQCRNHYGVSAVRDAETLRLTYPKDDERFIRLKVSERSRLVGWAVLLDTHLSRHRQFGNMRLGSIVSALASPADAPLVIHAATALLESRGVDLIVSNQAHAAWCRGLRRAGFLRGPSNFIFASSPQLTARLRQAGVPNHALHLNRGDGDGPINL